MVNWCKKTTVVQEVGLQNTSAAGEKCNGFNCICIGTGQGKPSS